MFILFLVCVLVCLLVLLWLLFYWCCVWLFTFVCWLGCCWLGRFTCGDVVCWLLFYFGSLYWYWWFVLSVCLYNIVVICWVCAVVLNVLVFGWLASDAVSLLLYYVVSFVGWFTLRLFCCLVCLFGFRIYAIVFVLRVLVWFDLFFGLLSAVVFLCWIVCFWCVFFVVVFAIIALFT